MEDITADNSTINLDFKLKARLLEIYKSASYSINQTTPTEYMEDLQDPNTKILEMIFFKWIGLSP